MVFGTNETFWSHRADQNPTFFNLLTPEKWTYSCPICRKCHFLTLGWLPKSSTKKWFLSIRKMSGWRHGWRRELSYEIRVIFPPNIIYLLTKVVFCLSLFVSNICTRIALFFSSFCIIICYLEVFFNGALFERKNLLFFWEILSDCFFLIATTEFGEPKIQANCSNHEEKQITRSASTFTLTSSWTLHLMRIENNENFEKLRKQSVYFHIINYMYKVSISPTTKWRQPKCSTIGEWNRLIWYFPITVSLCYERWHSATASTQTCWPSCKSVSAVSFRSSESPPPPPHTHIVINTLILRIN